MVIWFKVSVVPKLRNPTIDIICVFKTIFNIFLLFEFTKEEFLPYSHIFYYESGHQLTKHSWLLSWSSYYFPSARSDCLDWWLCGEKLDMQNSVSTFRLPSLYNWKEIFICRGEKLQFWCYNHKQPDNLYMTRYLKEVIKQCNFTKQRADGN